MYRLEISDEELRYIIKLVEAHGLAISYFKKDFLKRRIKARMMMTRMGSVMDYCMLLKKNSEEAKSLLDSAFINVSEFFRDPQLWYELSALFKKALINNNVVRIWSAACSCGEEPYSLAILASEVLQKSNNIRIIATDIDDAALRTAVEGIYDKRSLKNVPPDLVHKYFIKEGGDCYRVSQKIKEMVNFKRHDVLHDQIFMYCDIVLCRNLMIYFPRDVQIKLVEKFWYALKPSGYFIIGMSEVLGEDAAQYFEPYNAKLRIYKKRGF